MIRSFEKTQSDACLSSRGALNGRIPIFAVSASLEERNREAYIQTGFDGWILKPVDFRRVDKLLRGIVDDNVRNECLYTPGKWEQGGWFEKKSRASSAFDVDTKPSEQKPTTISQRPDMQSKHSSENSNQNSAGSITPTPATPTPGPIKSNSV